MEGTIDLIGLGPGPDGKITIGAIDKLRQATVIIGHQTCRGLVLKYSTAPELIFEDMSPVERARLALQRAKEGARVALVSYGDPGIFAIGSTFFSYLKNLKTQVPVEITPGMTMANSAAAFLGSPLGNDFAVISLADRSKSWRTVRKRIKAAAESDFVIVIYNPKGKLGNRRLKEAALTIMKYRKGATPVGLVSETNKEENSVRIMDLKDLSGVQIDINSTIIIGNSESFKFGKWMVTPRKYTEGIGY